MISRKWFIMLPKDHDGNDPKVTELGFEPLAYEGGVRGIAGTNVDTTATAKSRAPKVVSMSDTHRADTTFIFQVKARMIGKDPNLVVLSDIAYSDEPSTLNTTHELGYQGIISTEVLPSATILSEVTGDTANGFVPVRGASTPELRSDFV